MTAAPHPSSTLEEFRTQLRRHNLKATRNASPFTR